MSVQQKNKALKQKIQLNKHEIFIISIDEMDNIIKNSPKSSNGSIKEAWGGIKNKIEFSAGYYASADDLRTFTKLLGELGGVASKVYIKNYGGKPHIILKGNQKLRSVLTGTKYGVNNAKIITMGLGRSGAINAAKSGGILSIVLLTVYRVANYFLTDQATLSQLVGSLATDIVKVGIATGASVGAAFLAGGFTIAVGPILAVVIVGVFVSWGVSQIDQHYGITDRVIDGLDELGENARTYLLQKKKTAITIANKVTDSLIDYAIDSARNVIIDLSRYYLQKYISFNHRGY